MQGQRSTFSRRSNEENLAPRTNETRHWEEIMIKKYTRNAFAALTLICAAHPAHAAAKEKQLGSVHFETSCNPAAQKLFDRGMLYQHSFWYSAAKRTFRKCSRPIRNV